MIKVLSTVEEIYFVKGWMQTFYFSKKIIGFVLVKSRKQILMKKKNIQIF